MLGASRNTLSDMFAIRCRYDFARKMEMIYLFFNIVCLGRNQISDSFLCEVT